MAELEIEQINNQIRNIDFFEPKQFAPLPQPDKLRIRKPLNMCSLDDRNLVRDRLIRRKPREDFKIDNDSDLADSICVFMIDKKIPQEEKEIVSKYIDEELKKRIFELYLKAELKTWFKVDPDDISGIIFYKPKRNGVPLKYYYMENGILRFGQFEVSFAEVEKFLKKPYKEPGENLLLCIKHLLNDSGVVKTNWCPSYIKSLMENLNNKEWTAYEENMCQENDRLMKENLASTNDTTHQIHVNSKLKNAIINTIPEEFDQLEKSIYVYTKLCQILSYNPKYFVGKTREYNKSVSKIETIDQTNNSVVCYEFSYMLADLLREIGITQIKEQKLNGDSFKDQHANISFMVDGLVIFADSTRSVLQGDLTSLKYSSKMSGIRCELYDEESQQKFRNAKERVSRYINKEYNAYDSMLPSKKELEELSINSKFILFNNLLANSHLSQVDFIAYANRLVTILNLNVETKLFYNEATENFYLQIIPTSYFGEGLLSYVIDSTTKKVYDKPDEVLKFKEKITSATNMSF